jgi:hypothetical protein
LVTIGTIGRISRIGPDGAEQSFGTIEPAGQGLRVFGRHERLGIAGI